MELRSILDHVNNYNILNSYQHGFRPGLSQLILFSDEIFRAMDSQFQVDVLLHFSKAFDTVPHRKLLTKLACYGIQDCTL